MSIRWTDETRPDEEPSTEEIPAVEPDEERSWRWPVTWLGIAVIAAAAYGAGYVWGQEGVNHILALLIIFLLIDRALHLDGTEDARAEADLAREQADEAHALATEALEVSAEALEAQRRTTRDLLALARIVHGEDEDTTTGRHGRRN